MTRRIALLSSLALIAASAPALGQGSHRLTTGTATFDFDLVTWAQLGSGFPGFSPVLDEVFTFAQTEGNTAQALAAIEVEAAPSGMGLVYGMTGATVFNLTGRQAQPTDFTYVPGNLEGHFGRVGLGGMTRWETGWGKMYCGDYSLRFDVSRQALGGTGWVIRGESPWGSPVFDLSNVVLQESAAGFSLDADLLVSPEVASIVFATVSDTFTHVGEVTFTATSEPIAVGVPFCAALTNSQNRPGELNGFGSVTASVNAVTLAATGLPPSAVGVALMSRTQGYVPNPGGSEGALCLGGGIGVMTSSIGRADGAGNAQFSPNVHALPPILGAPAVAAGERWYFQVWHRDTAASGVATTNFTNGLYVDFL